MLLCTLQDPRDRVYNEETVSEDMLEFLQAFLEGTYWPCESLQHLLYCSIIHSSNLEVLWGSPSTNTPTLAFVDLHPRMPSWVLSSAWSQQSRQANSLIQDSVLAL